MKSAESDHFSFLSGRSDSRPNIEILPIWPFPLTKNKFSFRESGPDLTKIKFSWRESGIPTDGKNSFRESRDGEKKQTVEWGLSSNPKLILLALLI